MKKILIIALAVGALLVISSCAAGSERFASETPAGFWAGLWHGLICWITLIVRIFNRNVLVYEINNSGIWYDLGFVLGAIIAFGGSSSSAKRRHRCCGES